MSGSRDRQGDQSADRERESLLGVVVAFVQADSWAASEQVVAAHPELLREPADQLLAQLAARQQDDAARQILEVHRALLRRCREVGVGPAFADLGSEVPAALDDAFDEA